MKKAIIWLLIPTVITLSSCGRQGMTIMMETQAESGRQYAVEQKKVEEQNSDVDTLSNQEEKGITTSDMYTSEGYNVTEYGVSTSQSAEENGVALYSLIKLVENNGGGTIYFPAGEYAIQNTEDYIIRTANIRFAGDGESTRLIRYGQYPLIHVVGVSVRNENYDGIRLMGTQIDNMYILNRQTYDGLLQPIVVLEACSGVRINNTVFRGAGIHIDFIECFDSKIISTDFLESGRSYKADDRIKADSIDYKDASKDDYDPAVRFVSNELSYNQEGYEEEGLQIEVTNQIIFTDCRFESFRGGVAGMLGDGTNGIHFMDCKFESKYSTVPFFTFRYFTSAVSIDNCFFCKYLESSSGEDLSKVPIIYSDSLFMANNIDITASIQSSGSRKMNTDLILLNQNPDATFGANTITVRLRTNTGSGDALFADGCYVVNAPYPEELQLNGNITTVCAYNYYGHVGFDFQPLPEITEPPKDKWHTRGERLEFTVPDAEGNTEAICTESGIPGTWILK